MPKPRNLEQYLKKLEVLPPFQKKLKDIPNEDYELEILDLSETLQIAGNSLQLIGSLKAGPKIFVYNNIDDNKKDEEEEDDII